MSKDQLTVEYRDIPDFPGYRVGSDGSVWSLYKCDSFGMSGICRPKRLPWVALKPRADRKSRLSVTLCRDRRVFNRSVHRLVLEAFVGPCPEGMQCCHFPDRNPANNRLSNLRWDTAKANAADKVIHGTDVRSKPTPRAELDAATVLETHRRLAATERLSPLSPEDVLAKQEAGKFIDGIVSCLTSRQRQILRLRYGISGTHTLAEVGRILGVTRQRVQQIEAQAISELRDQGMSPR